jgi:hypothetical protein
MDDFAGNKMNDTIDEDFLTSEKRGLGIQEADMDNFMKAIGSAFPGDDFLNSIMDLSNFSDLQV